MNERSRAQGAGADGRARRAGFAACASLATALALLAAGAGCRESESSGPAVPPLIVVGVDGLEWDLVLRFAADGDLPNLAGLARTGHAARLETLELTLSPIIWTTIATGKGPEKHGITGFSYRDATGPHLYGSVHRRSKAIWNLLSERGSTAHVFGWWCTFPVEEISGRMVAQTATRGQIDISRGDVIWKGSYLAGLPMQVHPEEFTATMDRLAGDLALQADGDADPFAAAFGTVAPARLTSLTSKLWGVVKGAFYADVLFQSAAVETLREGEPYDAMLVYLGVVDVASHMFWRHFEPELFADRPPPAEVEDFGDVIRDSYRFVDRSIGELRALAPDADLLVVSDHGFHAVNEEREFDSASGRVDSGHHLDAPAGVLIAAGRSFRPRPLPEGATKRDLPAAGRVGDLLPTLLVRAGLPYGEDMDGRPLQHLLDEELLRERPVTRVGSWEDEAWRSARLEALRRYPAFEQRFQEALADMEGKNLDLLRALGYVGHGLNEPEPDPPDRGDRGK